MRVATSVGLAVALAIVGAWRGRIRLAPGTSKCGGGFLASARLRLAVSGCGSSRMGQRSGMTLDGC
jgi:hypothetical protein